MDLLSHDHAYPEYGNKNVVSFEEPQSPEVQQTFLDRLRSKSRPLQKTCKARGDELRFRFRARDKTGCEFNNKQDNI